MRYITRDALVAFIPQATLTQLTNDDPAAMSPDESVIDTTVTEVEDLVDGYMRGRYNLPFHPVPTVLRGAALSLVCYELYARRPEGGDLPEAVKAARKDAIKLLETIRDGLVTLGIADGKAAIEPGEIRVKARRQRFDDAAWKNY
jgi:phage gp36-like protein